MQWVNYWLGGTAGKVNDWAEPGNWTAGFVPGHGRDVEFATEANNPTDSNNPKSGPARENLHLDMDRVIGNLINASDKDLIITTSNELVINATVQDNNPEAGIIIIKADSDDAEPSGTLRFANPLANRNVQGTVEFYSKAYDCADCGFYTRSWQYFGIPVNSYGFPYDDVTGNETVKQWVEPFNGDKWRPAPYSPDTELKAFKGYQITNDVNAQPDEVYNFSGLLNVGNAAVPLTRTPNANYAGVNLAGNSYTAAIPINSAALSFPEEVDQTVYLFNTGTRDQWRKLSGSTINQNGYRSGQYLAVPVNLGGQDELPDRIPSMHSFMLLAGSEAGTGNIGNLGINYNSLIKNTAVNRGDGSQIITRSTGALPSLVMDVIGEESADRLWIFTEQGTTHGFDNGWDGKKMTESDMVQIFAEDNSGGNRFQVATVPSLNNQTLGFNADISGEYRLEFKISDQLTDQAIYLLDVINGNKVLISNGGSYTFYSEKGNFSSRFRLSALGGETTVVDLSVKVEDNNIIINNSTSDSCSIFISDIKGELIHQREVAPNTSNTVPIEAPGTYIVRIQNAEIHQIKRITIK